MLNGYKKSGTTLFVSKTMLDMKKMKAELNEHRHYLERNVERRTEHLLKRIAVLEFCNATLCGKLALASKEFSALNQLLEHTLPNEDTAPNDRSLKLYVMNNQTQAGSNLQDKRGGHATAA
jgi:hypothetical protein